MDYTALEQTVREQRDLRRPTMDLVVGVFTEIFDRFRDETDIVPVLQGPDTWSWRDLTAVHLGFEKWYVLSTSTMEGAEGYPLLTVRQSVAPRLDSFVSFSQLVIGPDARSIEGSLATAIANHVGAFDGIRQSVAEMIMAAGGMPMSQMDIMQDKKGESN